MAPSARGVYAAFTPLRLRKAAPARDVHRSHRTSRMKRREGRGPCETRSVLPTDRNQFLGCAKIECAFGNRRCGKADATELVRRQNTKLFAGGQDHYIS